jgi:hypothetical protein
MFLLLSSADASAGDFTVAYAFDAGDVNDAGKTTTCEYKTFCRIESDKLKLWISLSFWNSDHKEVDVQVSGNKGRPACCFFLMVSTQFAVMQGNPLFAFTFSKGEDESEMNSFKTRCSAFCIFSSPI